MRIIPGAKAFRFCDGICRRDFLQIGAFGALTLADLLRSGAQARPLTRRVPCKSVIHIFLLGGPPHLDTYDLKPDAPPEIRGEFKPIATNVPGVQICELLPLQARMWDKFAVIRSVVATPAENHPDAEVWMRRPELVTIREQYPSFGAVVSKLRGAARHGVPPFVSLVPRDPRLDAYNYGLASGYL